MEKKNLLIILKCIIFVSIFVYIFIHVSYMQKPQLAHTHKNISGYYAEPKNSLDAVFIGSSGTFSAFAPMEAWHKYGIASYNFCINRLGADVMPFTVIEAMKTQKPKVLILDVYAFINRHVASEYTDEADVRYNTDGFKYSINRIKLIQKVVPKNMNLKSFYFDLIKYHSSDDPHKDYFYARHNSNKGYNFLPWGISQKAPVTKKELKISADLDAYLDELLEVCKKQNTKVLFIYYPYGYHSDEASEQVNYVAQRVKKAGFNFLNFEDYQDEIALDLNKDCWDIRHFNIYGAEKITNFIAKYLVSNYNLPDRRKDKRYKRWHDDDQEWQEQVIEEKKNIDKLIMESKK